MPDSDITEVTAPVEFTIIEDRLHFTLVSGSRKRTYSISFHKARNSCHVAIALLDQYERQRDRPSNVRSFAHKSEGKRDRTHS